MRMTHHHLPCDTPVPVFIDTALISLKNLPASKPPNLFRLYLFLSPFRGSAVVFRSLQEQYTDWNMFANDCDVH